MRLFFLLLLLSSFSGAFSQNEKLNQYADDIKKYGQDPIVFVKKVFEKQDLIIFDDALHSAYEPFVFYNQLINDSSLSGKIHFIFLEVINTTAQPAIDSFLKSPNKDSTILMKTFQDDYSGFGWRYQTYMELFNTTWEHNRLVPDSLKIKIIGINPPVYWEAIHTTEDYNLFQNSLNARDYAMYLSIVAGMESFSKNIKGIFLTNTRHAYKNIHNRSGRLIWNTATFFNQWFPQKTFSIRIHNVTLSIQAKETNNAGDDFEYNWVKMDNGLWDEAFAKNNNKPVAVPFENTVFGKTSYLGNLMLNSAPGTTMCDAYDALIFLAPITDQHISAKLNFIYDTKFKVELERRIRLLNGNKFNDFLKENKAANFDDFYKDFSRYIPITKNQYLGE